MVFRAFPPRSVTVLIQTTSALAYLIAGSNVTLSDPTRWMFTYSTSNNEPNIDTQIGGEELVI